VRPWRGRELEAVAAGDEMCRCARLVEKRRQVDGRRAGPYHGYVAIRELPQIAVRGAVRGELPREVG